MLVIRKQLRGRERRRGLGKFHGRVLLFLKSHSKKDLRGYQCTYILVFKRKKDGMVKVLPPFSWDGQTQGILKIFNKFYGSTVNI